MFICTVVGARYERYSGLSSVLQPMHGATGSSVPLEVREVQSVRKIHLYHTGSAMGATRYMWYIKRRYRRCI